MQCVMNEYTQHTKVCMPVGRVVPPVPKHGGRGGYGYGRLMSTISSISLGWKAPLSGRSTVIIMSIRAR